ncbi:TIM barrel protein [Propionispora hippei]|uniref:Deoxyribonuclease-4 n=1 Tax=Propionispora hippei DSM 15287 TaxID=1123003 RepID=A0A1M6JWG0_9FIRM|nr:TIM barrel protein [Propionispora hippei]SHJ51045.1 deoxyribonuclease-4 [Propionispora hippei DSM 15287]
MSYALFGSAGNPDAFYHSGHKASVEMPPWLAEHGLTAYEYQCSRGARVKEATARAIGQTAMEHGIRLSIHAPYYISLATNDAQISANTVQHFIRSLRVAHWLGADRIVFHMGGCGKESRETALEKAKTSFAAVLNEVEKEGLSGIYLAPETMGKQNQLGNLEEVLALCRMSPWVIPAVDFGHLHAVSAGGYTRKEEYAAVFDRISEELGAEIAKHLHIHFSKIEFTKAGEKRHWTFADPFGPPHEPLLELCAERGYTPRIICESAGTQAADARQMQEMYFRLLGLGNR